MTLEPNDLLLFARVADTGSFTRASERLGLPKSTVSRRIAMLETQLGERLLQRTTRKLTLTDFGHAVLDHARQVVSEVEAAESLAQHRQAEPSGRLRVSMPADFANLVLGTLLGRFIEAHPSIALEIDLSARRVDLVGENFDLAIRMGTLEDDSTLVARRLASFSMSLYAAPRYLQRRGTPPEPEALMEHDSLRLMRRSGGNEPWLLTHGDATWEGAPPLRASANSPELLMRLACQGVGIVSQTDHFAEPYVKSGELLPVLPDWSLAPAAAWAVMPGRRLMPARTRAFIDALEAEFAGPSCQRRDREVQATRQAARGTGEPAAPRPVHAA